jgi:hypothetical protein
VEKNPGELPDQFKMKNASAQNQANEVKLELHKVYERQGYIFGFINILVHPTEKILFVLDAYVHDELLHKQTLIDKWVRTLDEICADESISEIVVFCSPHLRYVDLYATLFAEAYGYSKGLSTPLASQISDAHQWSTHASDMSVYACKSVGGSNVHA